MSVKDENPSIKFGGTWVSWGSGKVPVGVDINQGEFNSVEKIGGEKTHLLTINEMPSHNHTFYRSKWWDGDTPYYSGTTYGSTSNTTSTYLGSTLNSGNNQAHNNLQPYITCYMWKRTS